MNAAEGKQLISDYRAKEDTRHNKYQSLKTEKDDLEDKLANLEKSKFPCIHKMALRKLRRKIRENDAEVKNMRNARLKDQSDLLAQFEIAQRDTASSCKASFDRQANRPDLLIDLLEMSLDTDPHARYIVSSKGVVTARPYWINALSSKSQLNPDTMPPTEWGEEAAREISVLSSVRQLPEGLKLLRTLSRPDADDQYLKLLAKMKAASDDAMLTKLMRMDFQPGNVLRIGPGQSFSAGLPHWLGGNDVLLVVKGIRQGVPMVGRWDGMSMPEGPRPNEDEIFVVDTLDLKVIERKEDTVWEPTGVHFNLILTLQVI